MPATEVWFWGSLSHAELDSSGLALRCTTLRCASLQHRGFLAAWVYRSSPGSSWQGISGRSLLAGPVFPWVEFGPETALSVPETGRTFPLPITNGIMRNLIVASGAIVFAAGALLWCGNVFGFFVTFPFAGYLTLLTGGAIYKAGQKMSPQS